MAAPAPSRIDPVADPAASFPGEHASRKPNPERDRLVLESLHTATLVAHVLAGVGALLAGAVALVTTKGGPRHVRAGRLYVLAMGVVVVAALPLAAAIDNWFLLAVAVFSGYLVFAGYRVLAGRGADGGAVDLGGHAAMILAGVAMALAGAWGTVAGTVDLGPVLVVFGLIGAGLAVRELRHLRSPPDDRMAWFFRHLGLMSGGYIATVTAAVTVNLTTLPPLARWLGPTAVGVPVIVYTARRYEQQFERGDAESGTAG